MAVTGSKKCPIIGFEHYEISENGSISVTCRYFEKYGFMPDLTKRIDRAGYFTVRLNAHGKSYTKFVHRLVAEAFIENPLNLGFVNHKNGNKLDCTKGNLEWVSHSANISHAYKFGLIVKSKSSRRRVIDLNSGRLFDSAKSAAAFYKIPYSTCKNYLNGNRPNATCLSYY